MKTNYSIPSHIAIIMDGNRRWSKERGLPIFAGHQKVADEVLETLIEHASHKGIQFITFWAWSTDNWKRNKNEIHAIMKIFRGLIHDNWAKLHSKGVKIQVIGNIDQFDEDIQKGLIDLQEQTKNNTTITAIFALNYGGRDEILRAIEKMKEKYILQSDGFQSDRLMEENDFNQYLDTAGIPDPEMIVRTGGEKRLSGFLLWQSEYSELFYPSWYMPEFTPIRLDELLE
jgi:undecaprenyl diphosphate synthase